MTEKMNFDQSVAGSSWNKLEPLGAQGRLSPHPTLRPAGQLGPQGQHYQDPHLACVQRPEQATVSGSDAEIIPFTLREPCPCCGGPMRIIEIFRRGQKPMSRAQPRDQAA
nr:hypothetical protein [Meridianimarinicoccus roseus]